MQPAVPQLLRELQRRREPDLLEGCTAALIVDGPGELYTKSTAGELALAADMAGCALIGRPLVEGTGSLANFRIQAKNLGTDLMGAYRASAADLMTLDGYLDALIPRGGASGLTGGSVPMRRRSVIVRTTRFTKMSPWIMKT